MQNTADLDNIFLSVSQAEQVYDAVGVLDKIAYVLTVNFQITVFYIMVFSVALSVPVWFLVFYFKKQIKNLDKEQDKKRPATGKVAQIVNTETI